MFAPFLAATKNVFTHYKCIFLICYYYNIIYSYSQMTAILLFTSMLLLATAFAQLKTDTGENNDKLLRRSATLSATLIEQERACSYHAALCTIARSGRECGRASAACRRAMRMRRRWRKQRED
jgi:hypothetical protein